MKRSRQQDKPANLILEEVVGLTTKNGNGLASSSSISKFAYIAGCVVVLYDVHSGVRSYLMVPNAKPLSCVALSRDGDVVAAGESGSRPGVLVWNSITSAFICELKGHQYGVECMAVSHDGKHLVSIGVPRDGCMCSWDLQNKTIVSRIKTSLVSCPIASIEFSLDNAFVVTANKNQLKFWNVRWSKGSNASTRSTPVTMFKKIDLGQHKDKKFVAVASMNCMGISCISCNQVDEQEILYAVTEEGMLCMVHPSSSVVKSVHLEVTKCFALATSSSLVACACNNGLVKLFSHNPLKYAGRLLYAEANRCKKATIVDYKMITKQFEIQHEPTLPDAIACRFSTPEKLVVVYGDHSLYIWDIQNIDQATRCCMLVSHGGCIWDIQNIPCENMHDPSLCCVAKGCSGGLSFATCSVDGNIRLWDFARQYELSESSLCHQLDDTTNGEKCLVNAGIYERDSVAKDFCSQGFHVIAVSSDGKYLAAGDCQGNIHIFDLYSSDYICIKDAHSSEICSLSFNLADKNDASSFGSLRSHLYLASGGKDGRIHLYDVGRNFTFFGTIDCHSSAVVLVKVSSCGRQILSCSDGTLILHGVDMSSTECKFSCLQRVATSRRIYDVDIDHHMDIAYTVGEDKKIVGYDIQTGKRIKWFNHDGNGGAGDPVKITIDGSCSYLACSYSNRFISIYDCTNGRIVAESVGHGKAVTGIIFLPDCKHLISIGADSCIFVWKLPSHMTSRMLQRTKEIFVNFLPESIINQQSCNTIKPHLIGDQKWKSYSEGNRLENAGFKFSISRLPKWAQCKISTDSDINSSFSEVVSKKNNKFLEPERMSKEEARESGQQTSSGALSGSLPLTESSQISPSSSQTYSRRPTNQWLTIHTVCMDLIDSPDTCVLKGLNAKSSTTENISQSQVMEMIHPNNCIKLMCPDSHFNNPAQESNSEQNCRLCNNLTFSQNNTTANPPSLSLQLKKGDGEISTMTNWQRDIPRLRKRSLSTMHGAEGSITGSLKKAKRNNSNFLSIELSEPLLGKNTLTEDSLNTSRILLQQSVNDEVEEIEIVRSCGEALHNLEAAAEDALKSFSKIATFKNTGEDKSSMTEAAAPRLASIETKIRTLARLIQPTINLQSEK